MFEELKAFSCYWRSSACCISQDVVVRHRHSQVQILCYHWEICKRRISTNK